MTVNEYVYEMNCLGESICNDLLDASIMNESIGSKWGTFVTWVKKIWGDIVKFVTNTITPAIKSLLLNQGYVHGDININVNFLKPPKNINIAKIKKLLSNPDSPSEDFDTQITAIEDLNELISKRDADYMKKYSDGDRIPQSEINAVKSWNVLADNLKECKPSFIDNSGMMITSSVYAAASGDAKSTSQKEAKKVAENYKEYSKKIPENQKGIYTNLGKITELVNSIFRLTATIASNANIFAGGKYRGKNETNYIETKKRHKISEKMKNMDKGSNAYAKAQDVTAKMESAEDIRYLRAQLLIEAADALAESDDAGEPLPTVDEYDPEEGFVINEPEAEESEEYMPEVNGADSDEDISEDDEYTEEIENLLEDDDDAIDILTDDEGSEIIDAEPTLESILCLDL